MPPKEEDALSEVVAPWERNFREQMLRIRENREMTQTDLARRLARFGLPFHQQTIQRIEAGSRPVRLNEAHLIARELDVSLESMIATASPKASHMIFAVDSMRRGASRFADSLSEELGEWAYQTAGLSSAVHELLESYDKTHQDPVLVYGFNWANKAYEAYVSAYQALNELGDIVRGAEVGADSTYPEFSDMEPWWDIHDELFRGTGFQQAPDDDASS